ncbi:FAD-binding protein [Herbiconiux sp. CPCC 205716]|uniref:FAD-binding protein n=1 Tax=Herbiconiux gentiana TaxID=2970912 RepID=A0ABT2GGF0_9MICO|nr:D-arabinono-1,4-lactone oxidase [Herbiconiux gentiana]MCS5715308.1 FAD-binding protein [Herbiconiux gentiana]
MTAANGTWRNWARTEAVKPQRVERPASIGAVQRAVRAAARGGQRIKAVGAGHSFTGIAVATGVLLELDALSGLVSVDRERSRVTLLAGTRLHQLPALLGPHELALANMGDIDRQSISGAISTGTHGTGARFGGLATQVVGLTLVTADGELLRIDEHENAELLPAAALSLGALGIIVEVTLQCVPAFVLHAVERPLPLDEVLDGLHGPEGVVETSDHFEFYWFPHTRSAVTKTNTRLAASAPTRPLSRMSSFVDDTLLANGVYAVTCAAGRVAPAIIPTVNGLAERLWSNREFSDLSHRVFATSRTVRFREMEYAVPAADVPEVLRAVDALIEERGWRISFPIEVRFAPADGLWLSTASGRDSGYIAVHRYHREDHREYFEAVEEIMTAHAGRPHWGKLHTRGAAELAALYPQHGAFVALRDRLDPDRVFTNAYLDRVLGETAATAPGSGGALGAQTGAPGGSAATAPTAGALDGSAGAFDGSAGA